MRKTPVETPTKADHRTPAQRAAAAQRRRKKEQLRRQEHTLYLGLLSILFSCFMLAGSTYAWYTAGTVSAVNTIQAGTLAVSMVRADGFSHTAVGQQPLQFLEGDAAAASPLWFPGKRYTLEPFCAGNIGNLDFTYDLVLSFTELYADQPQTDGKTAQELALENLKLLEVMQLEVTFPAENGGEPLRRTILFRPDAPALDGLTEEQRTQQTEAGTLEIVDMASPRIRPVLAEDGTTVLGQELLVRLNPRRLVLAAPTGTQPTYGQQPTVTLSMEENAGEEYMGRTLHHIRAVVNAAQLITDEAGNPNEDKMNELLSGEPTPPQAP